MPVNSFENYPMSWHPQIEKHAASLYKSLALQLENDIRRGILRPGTKLPPQRELADYLDVNLSTITKAFKLCTLKGLLHATVGSGTCVSYDALSNMYLWPDEWKNPHIISLGATRPDNVSYEPVREQLTAMLSEPGYAKWLDYGTEADMLWHRKAGAMFIEREGFSVSPRDVFLTSGGQNALTAALLASCARGDALGADPETYPGLKTAAAMLGIRLVPIPHCKNEMDEDALDYACRTSHLKGLYLMPQSQNPTTHTMCCAAKERIARLARKYKLKIIEDASYNLLCQQIEPPLASLLPAQTFFIAGLSKAIAPGLRLAYMHVPPPYHDTVTSALYNTSVTVSPLMSELAARLIVSGTAWEIVADHQKETRLRSQLVKKYLASFSCDGEDTAIFRWLHLPKKGPRSSLFEREALSRGVQVYGAERFALGTTSPAHAVRIAITAPRTHAELVQGLLILKKLLDEYCTE
jgi:DNA-binding transcriptional MocR family regulator